MADRRVRVRYAPSPTGPQHIGGIRTALYNYLFAKKMGGDVILRIEDTDQTRFVEGAEEYIVESVRWLGFDFDEGVHVGGDYGPYRQSERKHMYRQYADQLLESGHAYYAFDTPEEMNAAREMAKKANMPTWSYNNITRNSMKNSLTLPADEVQRRLDAGDPYTIRIKYPRNEEIKVHDTILGWVSVNSNQLDEKILFKSDGMPTYHLANVVDDHLMEITHVIRGNEWMASLPLHKYLYQCLGWEDTMPEFAHCPLLLKPNGKGKLAKRDGVEGGFPVFPLDWKDPASGDIWPGYRESGYLPEAVINMLAFLGWNPGTTQEIFSMEEMIEAFTLERVGKSGAKFDPDKAKWYNQQYLRAKSDEELGEMLVASLKANGNEVALEFATKVAGQMKERAVFAKDLMNGTYFFEAPTEYDAKTVRKKWNAETAERMNTLVDELEAISDWTDENIETTFKALLEKLEVGMGAMLPNFRVLVTGEGMGPSMFAICDIIGKDETIVRMKAGIPKVEAQKAASAEEA